MLLNHIPDLFFNPRHEWTQIRTRFDQTAPVAVLRDLPILSSLPGICSYFGAVYLGWSASGIAHVKVSSLSALIMALIAWVAIFLALVMMGFFTHWMEETYGSGRSYMDCICFAIYVSFPLCLTGIGGLYPPIPITMLLILTAIGWSIWLLYLGVPLFMKIPEERGFLYASSIVCAALVVLVFMKVVTVFFWEIGLGPEFIPD
ncbi:Yip1 family protein [Endozoicomonas sp. 8E]|uniref:Yip1 family protein n=1 Tax=Endozoicomonas sp. 8E TaxID=3035692 RepID=UPI002938F8CF|nr:Yip1 family protein [Endozoicomonas sp. 8E]WOG26472.1 Yip1 family protein [Endozoicomonas sp. 8E]